MSNRLLVCALKWVRLERCDFRHSTTLKRNPRRVTNLHCECQELKPKGETNSSFLVLHPPSGVYTVKTVGSHLKSVLASKIEVGFVFVCVNGRSSRMMQKDPGKCFVSMHKTVSTWDMLCKRSQLKNDDQWFVICSLSVG